VPLAHQRLTGTAGTGLPEILVLSFMIRQCRWHIKDYFHEEVPITNNRPRNIVFLKFNKFNYFCSTFRKNKKYYDHRCSKRD
jgi:hypothetical protein